ncbi:MAG: molybdopterin-dependent oxidoreductase [Deltaproteobacteria bacterium]|nr:molybdopterin-dependent oxidoreductase [Deltaproteobacteria bacterium]MDQ3299686.1 molybdopterin-dependent oxidoreductase [Myxococcota bacterium]
MAEWRATACILCECNCGLEVELGGEAGRHLVKLRGDKRHPSSQGYACEKPHRLDLYQHGRDRVTSPLRRRADGTFEAIDWDTAIREVAARLATVRDTHGGDSIFYYGGGGQGNHLPGAYATATRRALGIRYRSSALAQEKTGEFWISDRMMGSATRADFDHCDVAMFLGKNPWHSHSIPRARTTLKQISQDPARTLIVVDPRRTETAELADIHLAVKPGTDAWLVAALLAILIEEDLIAHDFVASHVAAGEIAPVLAALRAISIADACARTGLEEALVRRTARVIGGARAFASFEDLGVQMNRNSTLVSYLHRLLIVLTGSIGKPGTHFIPTTLVDIGNGESKHTSPVVGARIVGGLVPCNVIAEEILTDHPKRYRAMIVEATNPAHSLADSKAMREAMTSLDTLVVIDIAMTETARLAHYVLPASTQFEKAEATFFNFDFPHNYFHLRRRLLAPTAGTLPEAEIHARIVEALGAITDADYAPFRAAAKLGRRAYAMKLMALIADPRLGGLAPVILYRTLELPDDLREGAVVFGLALRAAMAAAAPLARAGFGGSPLEAACTLFDAILGHESGVVFAVDEWSDVMKRIKTKDRKIHVELPDLLAELATLAQPASVADPEFLFVLTAGERRSFTANTIIRDPSWRRKDPAGALRINPDDAAALGVASGQSVRLTTRRDSVIVPIDVSTTMQRGHIALPNGLGLGYPAADGAAGDVMTGVAPNELTSAGDRDPFVGTPWHKHVPARIERID